MAQARLVLHLSPLASFLSQWLCAAGEQSPFDFMPKKYSPAELEERPARAWRRGFVASRPSDKKFVLVPRELHGRAKRVVKSVEVHTER